MSANPAEVDPLMSQGGAEPADDDDGDEGAALPKVVGIVVEESIHFGAVIVCADAEIDQKGLGKWQQRYYAYKSVLVMFLSFAFQALLIWMIATLVKDMKGGLEDQMAEFCDLSNNVNSWWNLKDTNGLSQHDKTCSGSATWNWASEQIGNMQAFHARGLHNHVPLGKIFGVVALMLWIATMFQEMARIINFLGLCTLPEEHSGELVDVSPENYPGCKDATTGKSTWDPDSDWRKPNHFVSGFFKGSEDDGELNYLSVTMKVLVVVIAFFRLVLASFLLYYGIRFLCLTAELTDFIMNSIALAFVLDIDDLAFQILLPRNQQAKVIQLREPLMTYNEDAWLIEKNAQRLIRFFVGHSDVFIFFAVIILTYFSTVIWLEPFIDSMEDVLCVLKCTEKDDCAARAARKCPPAVAA